MDSSHAVSYTHLPCFCDCRLSLFWNRKPIALYLCALPGFVDSKHEEKTERNAGYLFVSHSGDGMLRPVSYTHLVTGRTLPFEDLINIAHKHSALVLLDASQLMLSLIHI